MTDRDLINRAVEAAKNAYAPYSKLGMGAALECSDGTVVTGCTVENAALGSTICAEQAAVCAAVALGKRRFRRLAVYSGNSMAYCTPCGTCRQVLSEFSPDVELLCVRSDGRYVSYKLRDLMPNMYSKEHFE